MNVTITLTQDELVSCITEWNADQASQFVQTMIKEGKPNAAVKLTEKLVRGGDELITFCRENEISFLDCPEKVQNWVSRVEEAPGLFFCSSLLDAISCAPSEYTILITYKGEQNCVNVARLVRSI